MDYGLQVQPANVKAFTHPHWWLIIEDVTIAPDGRKRKFFLEITEEFSMTQDQCMNLVQQAVSFTKNKIEAYVRTKQMLHMDANPRNVLFEYTELPLTNHKADTMPVKLDSAHLIDWGYWIPWEVGNHLLSY